MNTYFSVNLNFLKLLDGIICLMSLCLLLRSNKVTCHICDELPGLLCVTEDLSLMREFLRNVNVFRILYTRGRFADLLNCWQVIGLDRLSVSKEYFEIIKEMEEGTLMFPPV